MHLMGAVEYAILDLECECGNSDFRSLNVDMKKRIVTVYCGVCDKEIEVAYTEGKLDR